jgi:hypothetical protein
VLENRVLRTIFGPNRGGVTGECRRLHSEELYDLYTSSNTTRIIKSRRMSWAGHMARMGIGEVYTGISWADLKETDHFGRCRLRKEENYKMELLEVGCGGKPGSGWLRTGRGGRFFECSRLNLPVP